MGGGASKKKHGHKIVVARAGDDAGEDVDPKKYISAGQAIVHTGLVWKLNVGADPTMPNEWLRRKMWLTDTGGLFYYSRQFGRPLGRAVATLRLHLSDDGKALRRFAFAIHTPEDEVLSVAPTVLATDSELERDIWVQHLQAICEDADQSGMGHVDPLEPLVGKVPSTRRRLNRATTFVSEAWMPPSVSSPANGGQNGMEAKASYSDGLRASMTVKAMRKSHTSQTKGATSEMSQAKSYGVSAFVERPSLLVAAGGKVAKDSNTLSPYASAGPVVRHDSQRGFAEKQNTFLVLDWDDTLFPTTFIRKDCGLHWKQSLEAQVKPGPDRDELVDCLGKLANKVEDFLDLACSLARVVIVTLAKRPWVTASAKNFMPGLQKPLDKYGINVVYARETVTEAMKRDHSKNVFKASEQEADFWMQAKASAMLGEIEKVYTSGRSWKNLLSFGDSDFERVALITAAEGYVLQEKQNAHLVEAGLTTEIISKDGHRKRIRAKTVKMLEEPALEEMIAQMSLLHSWLPHLIKRDAGIDVVLEDSDNDATLNELNLTVTGKRRDTLTWRELAGLEE